MKDEAPDRAVLVTNFRLNKGARAVYLTEAGEVFAHDAVILEIRFARKREGSGWALAPDEKPEEMMLIVPQKLATELLKEMVNELLPPLEASNATTDPEGV